MEDRLIVDLYVKRDERAIAESQKKYNTFLMTVATNILFNHEDSEESVNDTYMSAWNSIPPHLPECLKAFLAKITRSKALDIYRSKHAAKREEDNYSTSLSEIEEIVPDSNDPGDELMGKELSEAINKYLSTLKNDARNLFMCRYFYMDSLGDCAAYLGMTESKAKSMLFRTRNGLKEFLIQEGYEL